MSAALVPPFRFAVVTCARTVPERARGGSDEAAAAPSTSSSTITAHWQPAPPPCSGAAAAADRAADRTVYRGAYPTLRNFAFLRTLELSLVVSLLKRGRQGMTLDLVRFCENECVALVVVDLGEEGKLPPKEAVFELLELLRDERRLPAYVHCADGSVSTGVVVMCLRLAQGWSMDSACHEYCRYVKDGAVSTEVRAFVSAVAAAQTETRKRAH